MNAFLKNNLLYLAWGQVVLAILGSLYFSEIAGFTPCVLCWWQRIMMYPLLVILTVGILRKSKDIPYFVLPFSLIGLAIGAYQEALTLGWLPETLSSCSATVSCTVKYINWFGFVTIPVLSIAAFSVISALMLYSLRKSK